MTVETGTYINSLNAQFPPETDALSEIDEHLKIIKSTIKNTFPGGSSNSDVGLTAPVTLSAAELNKKTAIVSDGTNATFNTGMTAAKIKTLIGITEPVAPAITTATDSEGAVTPALSTGITAAEVWNLIKAEALNSTYPIGAIYTAITSGSPATVFGGTWVSFGQGRVLVGHDDSSEPDSDFVASSTDGSSVLVGGAKTADVTVSTTVPRDGWGNEQAGNAMAEPNTAGRLITGDGSTESGETMESLAHASGDRTFTSATSAVATLQPYVVVYMWKRTA